MNKFAKVYMALLLLFMVLVFVFKDRQEFADYGKLQEAGIKTLTPVKVEQTQSQTRTRRGSSQTYHNYVRFEVEIEGEKYSFRVSTADAYGEDSVDAGLKGVKEKKTIDRHIFYTEEHIYCSKTAETKEEFIKERIKTKVMVGGLTILIAGIAMFLGGSIGRRKENLFQSNKK